MNLMFSPWTTRANTILVAFSIVLFLSPFAGCKKDKTAEQTSMPEQENQSMDLPTFSTEIRSLPSEELTALGTKNDLPCEFVYPGAYFAQALFPEKINALEGGSAALEYFSESTFQLPLKDVVAKSNLVLYSKGFTLETLKDAKSGEILREGFPTPTEFVYLRSNDAFDKEEILTEIFKSVEQNKVRTEKFGASEAKVFEKPLILPLDQVGQTLGQIDAIYAAVSFPTDNSIVFASGGLESLKLFFGDKSGDDRGAVAQRLGRVDLGTASIVWQYDYDFDNPSALNGPLPLPITDELMASIQKNVRSIRFVFDASKQDGDLLTLFATTKTADGANELRKAIGTAIMRSVDQMKESIKQAESQAQKPADEQIAYVNSLIDILKTVNLTNDETGVVGSIKFSEACLEFISTTIKNFNDLRVNSQIYAQYERSARSLAQLASAFNSYLALNNSFPAPILNKDGEPILSWRVALLPVMGDQYKKLYDEFKLDEPWNSDANIKLLDKIPAIYASSFDSVSKGKTQFQIINSPDAPFGKAPQGLKLKDVENAARTLSVVTVAPELAVEWTKPETLAYNPEKPTETFGSFICANTLLGSLVNYPCDDSEATAKLVANLVYGTGDAEEQKTYSSADSAAENNAAPESEEKTQSEAAPTESPQASADNVPEVAEEASGANEEPEDETSTPAPAE